MAYAPSHNQSYIYSLQKSPIHKSNLLQIHNLLFLLSSNFETWIAPQANLNLRITMEGGTLAFPDLGKHCQLSDCHQLDFLPFKCDGCQKVFCVEHRSYKSHGCSNSDHNSRKVLVCETCSMSIEIPRNSIGGEDEKVLILEKHQKSGDCDPKNKKKPTCGVRRCKEILTFSNTSTCKSCQIKFCLKHRFQSDHTCKNNHMAAGAATTTRARPFLVALASRNSQDCSKKTNGSASAATPATSVKAY